jgi:putative transposase
VHLIRNTFRYAARQYWDEMSRDLRPVYMAPSESAAKERFVEFSTKWGRRYPAITRLWENAWSEFVPFLDWSMVSLGVLGPVTHVMSKGSAL